MSFRFPWSHVQVHRPRPPAVRGGTFLPASLSPLLFEPTLSGSAYILTDVTSSSISVKNNQHPEPIILSYGADTTFRRAVLQSWAPADPYYAAAEVYNQGDPLGGDTWTTLLKNFVGGNVRVVTAAYPTDPLLPPNPIRTLSFQPIP